MGHLNKMFKEGLNKHCIKHKKIDVSCRSENRVEKLEEYNNFRDYKVYYKIIARNCILCFTKGNE